jgi:hypothetical protein
MAGVIAAARERVEAGEFGNIRRGQTPGRHDAIACGELGTVAGADAPACGGLIQDGNVDPRVELDVAPEIEPIRNMVRITQDLRLRGVSLRPIPVLLQLFRELIGILMLSTSQRAPG